MLRSILNDEPAVRVEYLAGTRHDPNKTLARSLSFDLYKCPLLIMAVYTMLSLWLCLFDARFSPVR